MSKLDIILFGATGFTGRRALEALVKICKEKGITWGVAARNEDKLTSVLNEVSDKIGTDITKIPKFIADVGDEKSLQEMATNASAIINCCGPYRFFGEPVVKACLTTRTHHFDISGEPQFMEKIQLNYHKEAEEKGVYIVSACGFDCIVTDMGIIHLMNSFKGELNSVETYLEFEYLGNTSKSSARIHYGTWESAIYALVHANEMRPLREKLFPKRLPNFTPKLRPRLLIHNSSIINKWCLPFPSPDRSVALRSQRHFYDVEKQRPIQLQTYIAFQSFFETLVMIIFAVFFGLMVKIQCTRRLLLNYPSLFTFGAVSHEGPTDEKRANTFFHMTFYGQGWSEKKETPEEKHSGPPSKSMITKLSGQDPGYDFTSTALILSAITALKEADKMPSKGGVYPPGAAFAKTSLISELQNYGLKINILSEKDKK